MLRSTAKLTALSLMLSVMTSGCALADWAKADWAKNTPSTESENAEHRAEIQADQARLNAEKQAMLEMSLTHEIGEQPLQFKPLLAQLYAEHQYQPFWQDQQAAKQLLSEYAALVASGISKRASLTLEKVHLAEQQGGLLYDVLLTDLFLDYLYYSQNVGNQAQRWLYTSNAYRGQQPNAEAIDRWLSAVENQELLAFVQGLSGDNHLYHQTVRALPAMISDAGMTDIGKKLAINAQRLRVIPDFHNGIFVNIPSYRLQYYRDGVLTLESRVIVGKNARRTPVMYSKLSNVVVNPPWNAPPRLINEDIVPKLKADPGYAAAHNYSILDGQGNVIDPYSIDWASVGSKFPYRIRQAPGDSALGNYKFNMPSSDAIYLHDTPNHALFARKDRALSSGCVRVEKSDQLATILLKEAGWSEEKKQSVLTSKKTVSARILSDNPVFLYYVTAWVDNGKVQVLPDIYKYDGMTNTNDINWALVKKYL